MADERGGGPPDPDVSRAGVLVAAAGIAVVAAIGDPAGWVGAGLLVAAVATFGLWTRRSVPAPLLTVGVLVPVVLAQLSGHLEPATFLVSLLALTVAVWERSPWVAAACVAAAVGIAPVITALQPVDNSLDWRIWVLGIAFPAVIGRAVRRQLRLLGELAAARRELADRAVAEERRRIARDVHDLVGHGLAAVLLQVTSARHVLRRDPDAAEEALHSAELAGRRSMQELRRTLTLLRRDPGADSGDGAEGALAAPLPDLTELPALVESARAQGQPVAYHSTGDVGLVGPAEGLGLYRIAQEALVNAARHAPQARTVVTVAVTGEDVLLDVYSRGPLGPPAESDRPGYGLVGMRERAAVVGGELEVGPALGGWRVRCRVPSRQPDASARQETPR